MLDAVWYQKFWESLPVTRHSVRRRAAVKAESERKTPMSQCYSVNAAECAGTEGGWLPSFLVVLLEPLVEVIVVRVVVFGRIPRGCRLEEVLLREGI